ncbi:MAG: DUF4835 family protein [Bacteroidales bacterium]|nr:DUF4835 family protein [Bacteroidales bacterium]MCF8344839.1 DUF4835 family protein [Bacteroidales bacterium]MCF8351703.1 DUF4835 family protein [Bacteroidales bacterium]MCF8377019.1 DUF4835 family protein [Bacteroidales bacterium]MCF8400902.1 DUF4835 family protein [Bacteroidales bacterium]
MKKTIIILFFGLFYLQGNSQEIYCNVQVNSRQVEGSEKSVFEDLQRAIFDFINNRKWTNYKVQVQEKIECSILLTISERVSSNEFKGSLNLALRRPVFNSSYNSVLLNYVDDDFQFTYVPNQPLEFAENTYISELTSVLAYYIYIFLGLDFDTFTLFGGTPFYEKAEAIVSNAQNAPYPGWKAFEDQRNRYWLVENLLNPAYKPVRRFLYEYHRRGLDAMYENPDGGRAIIAQSLTYLQTVYNDRPGLNLIQVILDAKRQEIMSIFSEGSPSEKAKAVNIMREIDPANSSDYQELLNK